MTLNRIFSWIGTEQTPETGANHSHGSTVVYGSKIEAVSINPHQPAFNRQAWRNNVTSLLPFFEPGQTKNGLLWKPPLSQSLLFGCLFRRWSCGHNNSGDRFGGTRSCALLEMGCGDSLDAHLFAKRRSGQWTTSRFIS